jgi:lysophospholipase L1-like esterase
LLRALREAAVAGGLITLLAALVRHPAWVPALSARLCLAVLSLLLAVGLAEAIFRVARFDFRRQAALLDQTAPFWRLPRVPTGTVFFRREGGLEWTGQIVRNQLERSGLPVAGYTDEPVVTVRYDAFGFRNEPRPDAWEIAVSGDSFTELGFVPFEDLFTTILGRRLGCRVLNLGMAGTGPLAYLSYLQDYGLSPATTDLVVVFYEGNDLENLRDEHRDERTFETTGQRPFRSIQAQTSLVQALGEWLAEPTPRPRPEQSGVDAYFLGRDGEVAVTLGFPPRGRDGIQPKVREALDSFTRRYAAFARGHGLRAWLAYMPAKPRVLHGLVRFAPDAAPELREWQPGDLPEVIAEACAAEGIRFVDLTPALVQHTKQERELLYHHLFVFHLNTRGSQVVGEALAEAMREVYARP